MIVLCHIKLVTTTQATDPDCGKAYRVAQLALEPVNSEWGGMSFAPRARIDDDQDASRWNERCQIEA